MFSKSLSCYIIVVCQKYVWSVAKYLRSLISILQDSGLPRDFVVINAQQNIGFELANSSLFKKDTSTPRKLNKSFQNRKSALRTQIGKAVDILGTDIITELESHLKLTKRNIGLSWKNI